MKHKTLTDNISIESILEFTKARHIDKDIVVVENIHNIPKIDTPRRMGCLLLGLCLKGSATYTVNTVQHTVAPNDFIIISEGQTISGYNFSSDCMGITFMISQTFFNDIVSGVSELSSLVLVSRTHPVCSLLPSEVQALLSYCHIAIEKIANPEHHFRRAIVRSLFKAMIYDISNAIYRIQQLSNRTYNKAEELFNRFIKLVELCYRKERRVSWYAERLNITAKYLSESVKQVSGRTPNDWIDNYVTIELRVLLRNTNKSIKEIAKDMNFPNQSFLGTYFKEHVGVTPSAYRKEK